MAKTLCLHAFEGVSGAVLVSYLEAVWCSCAGAQEYTLAKTRFNLDPESCYRAAAFSVRDRLIETLNDTNAFFHEKDVKRAYYLSLEFLLGRGGYLRLCVCGAFDTSRVYIPDKTSVDARERFPAPGSPLMKREKFAYLLVLRSVPECTGQLGH